MAAQRSPNGGEDMKNAMVVIRLAAGGAILTVCLVSIGASLLGYESSFARDAVAALGGAAVTAGVFAKAVGLIA